jgi:hypothetical protein
VKTLAALEGVVQYYRLPNEVEVTASTTMLAGLVQAAAGVHITASGDLLALDVASGRTGSSLTRLFSEYSRLKGNQNDVALKQWCDCFRQCHRAYLGSALSNVDSISYYTSSMPAGTYKIPQESIETKLTSMVYDTDERGNDILVEVENVQWARDLEGVAPDTLLPSFQENVCRLFGRSAPGITAPMAYAGSCQHLFDVHFEECGIAAVNARVLFSVLAGGSPDNWRLSRLSRRPVDVPADHKQFWDLVDAGVDCIKELQGHGGYFTKKPVPHRQKELYFPNEFIDLHNDIGYKEWYIFNGNTADTMQLAAHVCKVLKIPPVQGGGIKVLQHFASADGNKLISLDPPNLPIETLRALFQSELQTGADVVYTDTRLHVGRGVCSFNTAWNLLPMGLFLRHPDAELGSCSPFTFNKKTADLSVGTGHSCGQWDSTSSKLFELLFHLLPDVALQVVLLQGTEGCYEAFSSMVQAKGWLIEEHVDASDDRALQSMTSCKGLSAARATSLYRQSFMCSRCGRGRVLKYGWVPENRLIRRTGACVWLCHVCAKQEGNCVCVTEDQMRCQALRPR